MNTKDFLGIERTGINTWNLRVTEKLITPGQFLFGGCALAAAVVALEEHSGRVTVWATAHYLSFAPTDSNVTITTTLAAEGRHITQARAIASIEGREILTVNASLGGGGRLTAPSPWVHMPEVAPPSDCPPRTFPHGVGESVSQHIDTRVALGRPFEKLDGVPGSPHTALWARVPGHLAPCAAMLSIFGDYVSSGAGEPLGQPLVGRSLDNTIRIDTLEQTEWVLCDIHIHGLSDGLAHGTGFLFSESGTLMATASQSFQVKLWSNPLQ